MNMSLYLIAWIAILLAFYTCLLLGELLFGQIIREYAVVAVLTMSAVALILILVLNKVRIPTRIRAIQARPRANQQSSEDALSGDHERLSSAFQHATIGMALVGVDGQWLKVNAALRKIVGYTEAELLSTTFQAITHPDDLDADLAFVRQMLNGEICSYQLEKRYFHKQGHLVWILLSVSLVHDSKGRARYFISQIQDITARKHSEIALRESERHYQAFMDNSPSLAFMKDSQGRYLYVNKRMEEHFQKPAELWIGKTDHDLWSAEVAEQFCRHDRECLTALTVIDRIETTPDVHLGVREWAVCKFPIQDASGQIYLGGVAVDITERKQAAKALFDSESRLQAIMANTPNMVFLKDIGGRYLLINRQFEKTFHVTAAEVAGKTDEEIFSADQAAAFQANDRQVLEMGKAMPFEEVALHDDGPHTSVVYKFPLHAMDGALYGIGGITADITERKRVENELLAVKEDLANELMAMSRLHEFSTRLVTTTALQPLLQEVLTATMSLQDAHFGNVQLYNPQSRALEIVAQHGFQQDFLQHFASVHEDCSACGRALHRMQRVIIEDVLTDPDFEPHRPIALSAGFRAVQSTPLFSRNGELLGVISTHFRHVHRPSDRELRITDLYARQAAEMIERKRAEETLRSSEGRLRHALEAREQLSQDLHDHVIQSIYAIGMTLETCRYLIDQDPAGASQRAQRAIDGLNDVIRQLRNYIEWGRLTTIPAKRFHEAFDEVILAMKPEQPLNIRQTIDLSISALLTEDETMHVLHILREALSNTVRHAKAKTVDVVLQQEVGGLRFEVKDDGVGFDPASVQSHGWGLRNIASRAGKLHAELKIIAAQGVGTQLILHIPTIR
ncbi:hypothetical protein W02_16470 [Nitrospira sp. KM1]|uniref:PAS domain S-box protein n=1 Tax=Nitrospira sp. KM1 TaxID=1936990 RepID=UPI0013A71243|nr:PAS domain S-box protein [Nitrospira sp. KM1]BCA54507.1 hypothetical protein W02_16470 [Nitrospira sp. KM1]